MRIPNCFHIFCTFALGILGLTGTAYSQEAISEKSAPQFSVTPLEQNIIEGILVGEALNQVADNQDTPLTQAYSGIKGLSIPIFSAMLHKDPLKADQLFKGQWFLVIGQLVEVTRHRKEMELELSDNADSFFEASVHTHLPRTSELEKRLSGLDKNDPVVLICQAEGSQSAKPNSLINCVPATDAVRKAFPEIERKLTEALEGAKDNKEAAESARHVLALEEAMSDSQKKMCLKGGVPCFFASMDLEDTMDKAKIPAGYLERGYTPEMLKPVQ